MAETENVMGDVYLLDGGNNLVLYESGNMLYMRMVMGESAARPVTLCRDYAGELSDVVYRGTVYYCYVNARQDVVVRSITDLQDIYRIDGGNNGSCQSPYLAGLPNALLLFYGVKNPVSGDYSLKALFPLEPQRYLALPEIHFARCPKLSVLYREQGLLLYAGDGEVRQVLSFDADLNYTVWENAEDCQRACAELEGRLSELCAEKNLLTEQLKRLGAEKDSVLESVRQQYGELMETALKYKEEAARWYEAAHKRETGPIPGERLLTDEW